MSGTYTCIVSNLYKENFRVVIIILKSQLLTLNLKETWCIPQDQVTNYCQTKFSSEVSWSLHCTNRWQLAETFSIVTSQLTIRVVLFC